MKHSDNSVPLNHRFSVAPMMERTDRHFRYLARLMSRRTLLYTEMVVTGAILRGDRGRFLRYDGQQHPLALQLGGSDPRQLAECTRIAEDWGYDEVNLNVGCPSARVQSGKIGACLMAEPGLVANCVSAMRAATVLPVTVKCRIGIDDQDEQLSLPEFVETVSNGGCKHFIVHARKAWLKGLSPKQNRDAPPLNYAIVHKLKHDNPDLAVVVNGGVQNLDQAVDQLGKVDGVMIGRQVYANPAMLLDVDRILFSEPGAVDLDAVVESYLAYIDRQVDEGVMLRHMARHLVGLFQGLPGAKTWRRSLATGITKAGAGSEVVRQALKSVEFATAA